MTFCCLSVVLLTLILASYINVLQGSASSSTTLSGVTAVDQTYHSDIDDKIKDNVDAFLENINNKIQKMKDKTDNYQFRHPGIDDIKKLSQRIKNIIVHHVKAAEKFDHRDTFNGANNYVSSSASKQLDESSSSHAGTIHSSDENERRTNADGDDCLGSEEHGKIEHRLNSEDKNNGKSSSSSESKSSSEDSSKNNTSSEDSSKSKSSSEDSSKNNSSSEDKDRINIKESVRNAQSSNRRERHENADALIRDIIAIAKDLKTGATETISETHKYDKSQVHNIFATLIQALHSANIDSKDDSERNNEDDSEQENESSEPVSEYEHEINEVIDNQFDKHSLTDNLRSFINEVREKFKADIKKVQSSKQTFIDAKADVIEAAKRLEESSSNEKRSKDHTNEKTLYLQELIRFKSKLRDMILKKRLYIREKMQLKRKVKGVLNSPLWTRTTSTATTTTTTTKPSTTRHRKSTKHFSTVTRRVDTKSKDQKKNFPIFSTAVSDTQDDVKQIYKVGAYRNSNNEGSESSQNDDQTTDSWITIAKVSDRDDLKLAASYQGGNDADDDEDNTTIILLTVTACLVISAAVCALVIVVWRKHRRHRLYVKLPVGNTASRVEEPSYSIW